MESRREREEQCRETQDENEVECVECKKIKQLQLNKIQLGLAVSFLG